MDGIPLSTHCLLDLYGCAPEPIDGEAAVRDAVEEACRVGGLRLLSIATHKFDPHGVTALALLGESHLSVHTWPERGYVAVDVFTCGDGSRLDGVCRVFRERFRARSQARRVLRRGAGPVRRGAAASAGG